MPSTFAENLKEAGPVPFILLGIITMGILLYFALKDRDNKK